MGCCVTFDTDCDYVEFMARAVAVVMVPVGGEGFVAEVADHGVCRGKTAAFDLMVD
jgi:hypothetical protein